MRATDLNFRSPKERTPAAYLPSTTNQGKSLTLTPKKFQPNIPQARRFPQYELDAKRTGYTVGPGQYNTANGDISKRSAKGVCLYKDAHGQKNMGNNGYYYIGNHIVFDPCFLKKNDGTINKDHTQVLTNRPNTAGSRKKITEQDGIKHWYLKTKTEKKIRSKYKNDYRLIGTSLKSIRRKEY